MMRKWLNILILLLGVFGAKVAAAQDPFTIPNKVVVDGESMENYAIKEVYVFPWEKFKRPRDEAKYRRMIYNIKRVYPYAILARDMLIKMEGEVAQIKNKRDREIYIKNAEKQLRAQFEEPLKKLTISQGKLLLKLIDRETGRTSYSIVKELRGSFSAFFWQSLARFFGSNLKSTFDAEGEDRVLNRLIILYENGQLEENY